MRVELIKGLAHYALPIGSEALPLNTHLGQNIKLEFADKITCIYCGRNVKKTFSQGYCYPCSQTLARCDLCIMRPELCHFHEGTCREPDWGEKNCFSPHVVYLSSTSGIKVGITRKSNVPTRWIDQGAHGAIALFEVQNRLQSGQLEVALKAQFNDKTDWRKMLKNERVNADLIAIREQAFSLINPLASFSSARACVQEKALAIDYPVLSYPEKPKSLNIDKNPVIKDVLLGIKGQYLIFAKGVLNVRKFSGYHLNISIN